MMDMKSAKYSILALIFMIADMNCFAWGPDGHKITGAIAQHLLDQRTKDSVKIYLGKATLEDVSTWMDEIKSDSKYDALKPLHYINMERGEVYVAKPDDKDIVAEINKVVDELKNRSKYSREEIEMDLKILTHLLGDIHQPLHVGFSSDQGGNMIQVQFMHRNSNLHRVWDSDIIEQFNVTTKDCLKQLSKYPKEDVEKLGKTDVVGWMKESRTHLKQAYEVNHAQIDYDYAYKNKGVIEKQLILGGIRLAHLLETIFETGK